MRTTLVAVLLVAVGSVCRAAEPDAAADTLQQKADVCIHGQAAAAASVTQNPNEAITFLVDGLCAVEVQRVAAYARNSRLLAAWRAVSDKPDPRVPSSGPPSAYEQSRLEEAAATAAAVKTITIDPLTGELNTPVGFSPPLGASGALIMTSLNYGVGQTARFRVVAATAMLAAYQAAHH